MTLRKQTQRGLHKNCSAYDFYLAIAVVQCEQSPRYLDEAWVAIIGGFGRLHHFSKSQPEKNILKYLMCFFYRPHTVVRGKAMFSPVSLILFVVGSRVRSIRHLSRQVLSGRGGGAMTNWPHPSQQGLVWGMGRGGYPNQLTPPLLPVRSGLGGGEGGRGWYPNQVAYQALVWSSMIRTGRMGAVVGIAS